MRFFATSTFPSAWAKLEAASRVKQKKIVVKMPKETRLLMFVSVTGIRKW